MKQSNILALLNWSVRVGSLWGIPINLHISLLFFLLAAYPLAASLGMLLALEFFLGVVLSILAHELGHALIAKRLRMNGVSIMLHGFGGFATSSGFRTPVQALVISLAGPAVTFVLAFLGLALGRVGLAASAMASPFAMQSQIVFALGEINLLLGIFNLMPSLPFDGGQALVAFLSRKNGEFRAMRIVAHLGLVFTIVAFLYGLSIDSKLTEMFAFMGMISSMFALRSSGGVRFGELIANRRQAKENRAWKARQRAKSDAYVDDVRSRERKRRDNERMRKLFGDD